MRKSPFGFECSACGARAPRWAGRCPSCQSWNALEERPPAASGLPPADGPEVAVALRVADADPEDDRASPTGLGEVDRVLAGGLRPGTVTLLVGSPGIGKSTLGLQVLTAAADRGEVALLASAEEGAGRVRRRVERLTAAVIGRRTPEGLLVLPTSSVDRVAEVSAECGAGLLVVDSLQTVRSEEVESAPGSPAQVAACLERLTGLARERRVPVVVVGHVTKEGLLAGPRRLEHLVDTVLWLEGERHGSLRFVRTTKHRHGPTGSVGVLRMEEQGLVPAEDPARLLLRHRREAPGSVVVPVLQGDRPLPVEIQALVVPRIGRGAPRCHGVDPGRVGKVLAVLDVVNASRLSEAQVFVSTVGGLRVTDPAADLGTLLAVLSATVGVAWPAGVLAFGEIGLTGEVREVPGARRRLDDAARLGFTEALVPAGPEDPDRLPELEGPQPAPVRIRAVTSVAQALVVASALMLDPGRHAGGHPGAGGGRPDGGDDRERPPLRALSG